jgi:hypothetical protein
MNSGKNYQWVQGNKTPGASPYLGNHLGPIGSFLSTPENLLR